jgi:hypothetical protein
MIQELRLWYQETQCFYYSRTYDLTSSIQRSYNDDVNTPLWKRADERFFWNRQMLSELIDQADVFFVRKFFKFLNLFFNRSNIWILDGFNQ